MRVSMGAAYGIYTDASRYRVATSLGGRITEAVAFREHNSPLLREQNRRRKTGQGRSARVMQRQRRLK